MDALRIMLVDAHPVIDAEIKTKVNSNPATLSNSTRSFRDFFNII
jgi:hypothetical protein